MTTKPKAWIECQDCKICPRCAGMGMYGITRQESVLIHMLCQGLGTADIISQLRISEETLKRHFTNIFNKTGVDSRPQLIVFAVAKGLAVIE